MAGTSRIRSKNKIPCVPNTTYYFASAVYTSWVQINFYDENEDFVSLIAPNVNRTFTTPSDSYYMTFNTPDGYGATYNHDISINYPSTDTEYHPYDGQTITTPLPTTVYGGTVDVVNGTLTVDRVKATYNGSETWLKSSSALNGFYRVMSGMMKPSTEIITNRFQYTPSVNTYLNNYGYCYADYSVCFSCDPSVCGSTVASWKEYLADNPLEVVYHLATPQTYSITPQQIQTLLGRNNVWSDGSVTVEYVADPKRYIEKMIGE